jgi:hypothetical protein
VIPFGDVTAGNAVQSLQITLFNTTSHTITVTNTPNAAAGYSIVNIVGSNAILPGGQMSFDLRLVPLASKPMQVDSNAVVITMASQTFVPQQIEAQYNTLPFIPAFIVSDTNEAMLLGFFNAAGQVTMLQADGSNLSCEEDVTFAQYFDFKMPETVKQLLRYYIEYEAFGATEVTVVPTSSEPSGQTAPADVRNLSALSGGALKTQLFDNVVIAGQLIRIDVTGTANTGGLSIVLVEPYYEVRGEVVEAS